GVGEQPSAGIGLVERGGVRALIHDGERHCVVGSTSSAKDEDACTIATDADGCSGSEVERRVIGAAGIDEAAGGCEREIAVGARCGAAVTKRSAAENEVAGGCRGLAEAAAVGSTVRDNRDGKCSSGID